MKDRKRCANKSVLQRKWEYLGFQTCFKAYCFSSSLKIPGEFRGSKIWLYTQGVFCDFCVSFLCSWRIFLPPSKSYHPYSKYKSFDTDWYSTILYKSSCVVCGGNNTPSQRGQRIGQQFVSLPLTNQQSPAWKAKAYLWEESCWNKSDDFNKTLSIHGRCNDEVSWRWQWVEDSCTCSVQICLLWNPSSVCQFLCACHTKDKLTGAIYIKCLLERHVPC